MKKMLFSISIVMFLCLGVAHADLIRPGKTPWWEKLDRLTEKEKLAECQELKNAHPNIKTENSILPTRKKWDWLKCEERLKDQSSQKSESPIPQGTTPSVLPPGVLTPLPPAAAAPNAVLERCIELKEEISYMETAETGIDAPQILNDLRNEYTDLNCTEVLKNARKNTPQSSENSTSQAEPSQASSSRYGLAGLLVLLLSGGAFVLLWHSRKQNLPRAL